MNALHCLKEWAVIPGMQDFNGDLALILLNIFSGLWENYNSVAVQLQEKTGALAAEPDPPLCSHGASARNVATRRN